MPILRWLLAEHLPDRSFDGYWADFSWLVSAPKTWPDRIRQAIELYPGDVLFVHRDADTASVHERKAEIDRALAQIPSDFYRPSWIKVIPVRMTEAWLLIEEAAIRIAAGTPRGRLGLSVPKLHELEALADPKQELFSLLRQASELKGRRLKRFSPDKERHRVAEFIKDFGVLRRLSAFQSFEADVRIWAESLA